MTLLTGVVPKSFARARAAPTFATPLRPIRTISPYVGDDVDGAEALIEPYRPAWVEYADDDEVAARCLGHAPDEANLCQWSRRQGGACDPRRGGRGR